MMRGSDAASTKESPASTRITSVSTDSVAPPFVESRRSAIIYVSRVVTTVAPFATKGRNPRMWSV